MTGPMVDAEHLALGASIARLRARRGLAKADLARRMGLDPSAVTLIEQGRRKVSGVELARIADVLGVSVLALLEPDSPLARFAVSARVTSATPPASEQVIQRAQGLAELHELLREADILAPERAEPMVGPPPGVDVTDWQSGAPALARWARKALKLDARGFDGVFIQLVDRIVEKLGVDVLVEPHLFPVHGLTVSMAGWQLILVNSTTSRRRQLFTLAHELGHLLADDSEIVRVDETFDNRSEQERFANAFAAELLMPADVVNQLLGGRDVTIESLLDMYDHFGVSIEALTYRLHNLNKIDAFARDQLRGQSARELATKLDTAVAARIAREPTSPTNSYIEPPLLTERAFLGFRAGVISVRPYAELIRKDPKDVLDEAAAAGAVSKVLPSV